MAALPRHLIHYIVVGAITLALILLGLGTWLWYWQPSSSATASNILVPITLREAIRTTVVLKTYPKYDDTSVRFVRPTVQPKLSSQSIISKDYMAMGQHWYSGPVQMFYTDAVGLPGVSGRHSVWAVENHMLFSHSEPFLSTWSSHMQGFVHKARLLVGIAKPMTATSYEIFDAMTGKFLGAVQTESGGYQKSPRRIPSGAYWLRDTVHASMRIFM